MLTANTINDEQIRDLRTLSSEEGEGATLPDGSYLTAAEMIDLCDAALGYFDFWDTEVTSERVFAARARCAEILNARAAVKP